MVGGALGIFKLTACVYNQSWTLDLCLLHICFLVFFFLSKRSGWRMLPAERSTLYTVVIAGREGKRLVHPCRDIMSRRVNIVVYRRAYPWYSVVAAVAAVSWFCATNVGPSISYQQYFS